MNKTKEGKQDLSRATPKPPQDTSLDDYLVDLVDKHFPKGECKERGQAFVMLHGLLDWHKQQQIKLIERIEGEVSMNQKGQFEDDAGNICWYLDDLLEAINKLKESLDE